MNLTVKLIPLMPTFVPLPVVRSIPKLRGFSSALGVALWCVAGCHASHAAPAKPTKPAAVTKPAATNAPTNAPAPMNPIWRNASVSKTPLLLAQDGEAKQPIVIAANASATSKACAQELATYLKRISGATFEVETGDGSKGIVLGTRDEFPTPALDKALEIQGVDGREAFAIRTRATRVLLLAATRTRRPTRHLSLFAGTRRALAFPGQRMGNRAHHADPRGE